jgi:hypothetical protein
LAGKAAFSAECKPIAFERFGGLPTRNHFNTVFIQLIPAAPTFLYAMTASPPALQLKSQLTAINETF